MLTIKLYTSLNLLPCIKNNSLTSLLKLQKMCLRWSTMTYKVESVYKDHQWVDNNLVFVHRWSSLQGQSSRK